jgi:hypothetical protein
VPSQKTVIFEKQVAYNILVRNLKGRSNFEDLGIQGRILEECEQDLCGSEQDQCRDLVNTVMKLVVP